jgi:hypothetical protein
MAGSQAVEEFTDPPKDRSAVVDVREHQLAAPERSRRRAPPIAPAFRHHALGVRENTRLF